MAQLSGALGADRTATREQLPLMPSLTAAKKEWLSLPVMSLVRLQLPLRRELGSAGSAGSAA